MSDSLEDISVSLNQPLYVYRSPMFMLTVSVVLIVENGVIVLKGDNYKFPGGVVRAHLETIQFSAVRHIKEQTGIVLKKEALIPVDFRSSPERSKEGNVVDIGMLCVLNDLHIDTIPKVGNSTWIEVDFEDKLMVGKMGEVKPYMDHDVLLERAIDIFLMMRED